MKRQSGDPSRGVNSVRLQKFFFIIKTLIYSLLVFLVVGRIVFGLVQLAPGDIFDKLFGDIYGGDEIKESWRDLWPQSYWGWIKGIFSKKLFSLTYNAPVVKVLFERGILSAILIGGSLIVSLLASIAVTAFSVNRRNTLYSWCALGAAYLVSAVPAFYLAEYSVQIGLYSPTVTRRLLLGAIALGIGNGIVIQMVRLLRAEAIRIMNEDYIVAARARGLSAWRESRKRLMIVVSEIVVRRTPFIIGASVAVESALDIPGLGKGVLEAARHRDFPLLFGITMLLVFAVCFLKAAYRVFEAFEDRRILQNAQ